MAQPKITYADKVQGQVNPAPIEEKYTADDANEVKTAVNAHADQIDINEIDIEDRVVGPASSTDNFVVVFDGASGKIIKIPNAAVNFGNQDASGLTGLTINRSGSGNPVIITHSGNGNAVTINKSASGDGLDVASGSVRIQELTADRYLFIDSNNRITVKTTAEILSEIGALPLAGGTMTGAILGDQSARLYRPQSENSLTVDTNLSNLTENTTILINASASNVTITVDDAASALPIGTTFEFIQRIGSNDVIFAASGSQSILSADDNLKIRTRFAGAILTKQLNNSWYLIGDLKA